MPKILKSILNIFNIFFHSEVIFFPTFGRIYKIIDFGRSIFTYNDKLYYSDAFDKNHESYYDKHIEQIHLILFSFECA